MSSEGQAESNPDLTRSRSNNGGGKGHRRKGGNNQRVRYTQSTFKGETEGVSGHIYDFGVPNQAYIFTETTKKLASYAGQTYKEPQDIRRAIEDVVEIAINMPTVRANITDTTLQGKLYDKCIKIWSKRESLYRQNKAAMFSIVLGQCTEAMKSNLESESTYETIANNSDVIELLKLIRNVEFSYDSKRYPYLAMYTAMKGVYGNYQKNYTNFDAYLESFQNLVSVVEHCGGNFAVHPNLIDYVLKNKGVTLPGDATERKNAEEESKEAYLAMAFLNGLNKYKYQDLMDELSNAYLTGRDEYSKNIVDTYNLVTNWKNKKNMNRIKYNDGVNFNTIDENGDDPEYINANRGILRTKKGYPVKCFHCGDNHFKSDCPLLNQETQESEVTNTTIAGQSTSDKASAESAQVNNTVPATATVVGTKNVTTSSQEDGWGTFNFGGVTFFSLGTGTKLDQSIVNSSVDMKTLHELVGDGHETSIDHVLQQSGTTTIPEFWTLLDNQSTVDVFANGKLLQNIREVPMSLKIVSTGGMSSTNKIGLLQGYGWVWYHPTGIANILSLSRVKSKFRICYDSTADNMFHVFLENGRFRSYRESSKGLYYSDIREEHDNAVFVNTVAYNKSKHSRSSYLRALNARILQNKITGPSVKHFKDIIRNKQMTNCPVTEADIENAEDFFGSSLQCLKGKNTRNSSIHAREILIRVPHNILASYCNVTLSADVMSVNGLKFLITHSRHIRFTTTELVQTTHNNIILKAILNVRSVYKKRGFMLRMMLMDGAFESLRGALAEKQIESNICSENEHVGEIERTNSTVKERCRGIFNTIPFKRMPGRMIAELFYAAVFWLNSFHPSKHLLNNLRPRTIMTGRTIDFKKHCKHEYGAYVQTHEATYNTMAPRTIGAIALRPTGN